MTLEIMSELSELNLSAETYHVGPKRRTFLEVPEI